MRKFFPSLNKYSNYIFCDNAGGSQIPSHVLNNFEKFITNNYVQPKGNTILSKNMNNQLDNVRNIIDILLNNKRGTIVFGGSCTQLTYNLANSMENYLKIKDSNFILSNFSHEACISPFERIAKKNNLHIKWWCTINNENNNYKIDYNELLNMVDINTQLVVIPHVSNILGNIIDIKFIINEIKKKNSNTKILVDGVAYMPHGVIDVDYYNVDYYIVSFYKFCGLRISALYCLDDSLSINKNQNHYFFDNLNDKFSKKLELGGYNYECASSIIGLKDYLITIAKFFDYNNFKDSSIEIKFDRQLVLFVMDKIKNYEKIFSNMLKNSIKNLDNVEIVECNEKEKIPIYSLKFKDYNENNINLILNNLGILTSNGTFYCNRFFDINKLDKSRGLLRISLMHYNTIDECVKILDTLKLFVKIKSNFDFYINSELKNNICKDLKISFNDLNIDNYYENKRYRAYSLLSVKNLNNITIEGDISFYQADKYNNFNGNILRNYSNISKNILSNKSFKELIKKFKNTALTKMNLNIDYIQVHQIRVYANENNVNLVPEGLHQDGYNIIGMSCITRNNINGATSNIYDNNKNLIHSTILKEGELLILNDNKLYHDVTSIELIDKESEGFRDIFVFTSIS